MSASEASRYFAAVLDAVEQGETIVVTRSGQALDDHANSRSIRAVDEDGAVLASEDGSTQREINDRYLRNTWPKSGAPAHVPSPATAQEKLQNALADLGGAVETLVEAANAVCKVSGTDDQPLVEVEGVSSAHCNEWRKKLSDIEDALILWGATHKRRYGTGATTAVTAPEEGSASVDEGDESGEAA